MLTPSHYRSGRQSGLGRITDRYLRSLRVQGARAVMIDPDKKPDDNRWQPASDIGVANMGGTVSPLCGGDLNGESVLYRVRWGAIEWGYQCAHRCETEPFLKKSLKPPDGWIEAVWAFRTSRPDHCQHIRMDIACRMSDVKWAVKYRFC